VQFFAGFEANGFAGSDGDFRAGARVASYAGFAGAHVEDTKTAQFNTVAGGEGFFQAFKDRIDCRFGFIARQARTFDDVMDNVLFYQRVHLYLLGLAGRICGYRDTRKVFLHCQCAGCDLRCTFWADYSTFFDFAIP